MMDCAELLSLAKEWESDPHSDLTQRACAALLRVRVEAACAMTLTEFLLARIAEDEAGATSIHHAYDCDYEAVKFYGSPACNCLEPARVLAECEAKRRIVGLIGDPGPMVFRLLALPYADHADYRAEWRS